jgi:hypothetical protein
MMAEADDAKPGIRDVLDPTDRFSEVVFGVIKAMTFAGTVSVANEGEWSIRQLLTRGRRLQPRVGHRRRRRPP